MLLARTSGTGSQPGAGLRVVACRGGLAGDDLRRRTNRDFDGARQQALAALFPEEEDADVRKPHFGGLREGLDEGVLRASKVRGTKASVGVRAGRGDTGRGRGAKSFRGGTGHGAGPVCSESTY